MLENTRLWGHCVYLVPVLLLACGPGLAATGGEGSESSTDGSESSTEGSESSTGGVDDSGSSLCDEHAADIEEMLEDIDSIVAGTVAFFADGEPSSDLEGGAPHRCPHPWGVYPGTAAGVTPDLILNCNEGEGGMCTPMLDALGLGNYSVYLWFYNSVWSDAGFFKITPHTFHYDLVVANSGAPDEFGACDFAAVAVADWDDDFVFSSYSISGHLDENGAIIDDIVIEMPCE